MSRIGKMGGAAERKGKLRTIDNGKCQRCGDPFMFPQDRPVGHVCVACQPGQL